MGGNKNEDAYTKASQGDGPVGKDFMTFMALARITDGALLASIFVEKLESIQKKQLEKQFLEICNQERQTQNTNFRTKLTLEYPCSGFLYCQTGIGPSKSILFALGLKDRGYPDAFANRVITEIIEQTNHDEGPQLMSLPSLALSRPMKKVVRDVIKKFAGTDPNSKVVQVQRKVDALKDTMQDNIRNILETHHALDTLELKTDKMEKEAADFQKTAVIARKQQVNKNRQMNCIILIIVCLVIGGVVSSIASMFSSDKKRRQLMNMALSVANTQLPMRISHPEVGMAAQAAHASTAPSKTNKNEANPSFRGGASAKQTDERVVLP